MCSGRKISSQPTQINRTEKKSGRGAFQDNFVPVPISKLCEQSPQSFLSSIPRTIDGAVVTSRNERDIDCLITFQVRTRKKQSTCVAVHKLILSFQTESILERFMLRFEELKIDCNDKLVIYDGAHATGNHKVIRFSGSLNISPELFSLKTVLLEMEKSACFLGDISMIQSSYLNTRGWRERANI